jgi:hypothetical protein
MACLIATISGSAQLRVMTTLVQQFHQIRRFLVEYSKWRLSAKNPAGGSSVKGVWTTRRLEHGRCEERQKARSKDGLIGEYGNSHAAD